MRKPEIIQLPKMEDPRGNLSFVEGRRHLPFEIRRAYWIYDVPGGATRGGHAYYEQEEMIIALSGSFDVILTDGKSEQRFHLNRSYFGLYIPPGYWRQMVEFSTNSVALVLSSTEYSAEDYIYEMEDFLAGVSKEELKATDPDAIAPFQRSWPNYEGVKSRLADCEKIALTRIESPRRGNLTTLYPGGDLPFSLKRIFYIYDIPGGESRGGHVHKECHEYFVAVSGSFEIRVTDGCDERTIFLSRPYEGFHLPPGVWAQEVNFSSGAVCLVATSHPYEEKDYIRDWKNYLTYKSEGRP